jgi:hypothetical protein
MKQDSIDDFLNIINKIENMTYKQMKDELFRQCIRCLERKQPTYPVLFYKKNSKKFWE